MKQERASSVFSGETQKDEFLFQSFFFFSCSPIRLCFYDFFYSISILDPLLLCPVLYFSFLLGVFVFFVESSSSGRFVLIRPHLTTVGSCRRACDFVLTAVSVLSFSVCYSHISFSLFLATQAKVVERRKTTSKSQMREKVTRRHSVHLTTRSNYKKGSQSRASGSDTSLTNTTLTFFWHVWSLS